MLLLCACMHWKYVLYCGIVHSPGVLYYQHGASFAAEGAFVPATRGAPWISKRA